MKPLNDLYVSLRSEPPAGASVWVHSAGLLTGGGSCRFAFAPAGHVGPHLILSGQGVVRYAGTEQGVTAGDMFCLLPGVTYEYCEDPLRPWRYAWLHLEGTGAVEFAAACGFTPTAPLRPAADLSATAQVMEALRQSLKPPEGHPHGVMSLLHAFAQICNPATVGESVAPGGDAALLHRARLVTHSSLHTGLNVTELAGALGISRTKLYLVFCDKLGTTPVAYLANARIERAKRLLSGLDLSTAEVASAAGFRSPKYFA
ncbi:MAG: helix-turn-helix domain-containing protein, partial [Victivallales bacterium]|nr:helix-turn-helix domain-containing protein [Victivallales bacterium]